MAGFATSGHLAQGELGVKLNEEKNRRIRYAKSEKGANLAPQRKLANEQPQGDYDGLIKSWKRV
jgi:glycerol transport system substrate-binding protein